MRLAPATCPVCRRPAKGMLEIIPGLALPLFGKDGHDQRLRPSGRGG